MAETAYQVRILNTSGVLQAVITHWRSLAYERRVNHPGSLELHLSDDEPATAYLTTDAIVEVWRRVPGSAWYREFTTLQRTAYRRITGDGLESWAGYLRGAADLLARRILLGYAGTAYTEKSGPAETVLKALVTEQAVSGGAIARAITGLTVETDGAGGNTIRVAQSYANLLEVLQKFAGDVGGGDFDLANQGGGAWAFNWYDSQLGTDRRSATTAPVIFATGFGNMQQPTYGLSRAGEVNAVTVGGSGQGAARATRTRTRATAIAVSTWNRCEAFRQLSNTADTDILDDFGDAALEEGQAREKFDFAIVQAGPWLYGRDYFLGDLVTCRFGTVERDKKLVAVRVAVNEQGERVELETADVPR